MRIDLKNFAKLSLFAAAYICALGISPGWAGPPSDYFTMQTILQERNNRCLESNRIAPGAFLGGAAYMAKCENVSGQFWKAIPDGDGYFHLTSMFVEGENKCLEGSRPFAGNDPLKGAVRMDPCGNFSGQKWRFIPRDNGYYQLTNANLEREDRCLESSGPDAPGDPMGGAARMDPCGNFTGQLWKLTPRAQAAASPSGRKCADEGGYCSFRGTLAVSYGVGNRWVTRTFANGVSCTNAVFGDPAPGVRKACFLTQRDAEGEPQNRTSSFEPGQDRQGGDYHHYVMDRPDPADCMRQCIRDARCTAWTYAKPGISDPTQAVCWLKNTVPPRSNNECCTSGKIDFSND